MIETRRAVVLPQHGRSFHQIDEVLDEDLIARTIETVHRFTGADYLCEADHLLPVVVKAGVLHLESMAQTFGQLVMRIPEAQEFTEGKTLMFSGIGEVRFPGMAPAGSEIIYKCQLTYLSPKGARGNGQAFVDEKLVCEAKELRFVFVKASKIPPA